MIQLVVIRQIDSCIWCAPTAVGNVIWVRDANAARHLIENGFCRLPEASAAASVRTGPLRRSDSWPLDRFAVIERSWEGETAAIICSGPSLAAADLERIRGRVRVIAVNDNYLVARWADVCYFADARWWKWHTDGLAKSWPWLKFTADEQRQAFAAFSGQKVTIESSGHMVADPEVFMLHNFGTDGLSEKQNGLCTGVNSGYQAINLAVLAGARRILLLGYDMRFAGARSHAHDGHPIKRPEANYMAYAQHFKSLIPPLRKLGVEVVNCTPGSAIAAFRFGMLEAELA